MQVVIAEEAEEDVDALPLAMRARFDDVITRLEAWPNVSGVKALRGSGRGTIESAWATGA